jgi:hypothetical protein
LWIMIPLSFPALKYMWRSSPSLRSSRIGSYTFRWTKTYNS